MLSKDQFSFVIFNKYKGWAMIGTPILKLNLQNNCLEIFILGKMKIFFSMENIEEEIG